jgi:hypothetical protein
MGWLSNHYRGQAPSHIGVVLRQLTQSDPVHSHGTTGPPLPSHYANKANVGEGLPSIAVCLSGRQSSLIGSV